MTAAKQGDGPWGAAIKYWLPRKNKRQADLARETGIGEKTISTIARGMPTTTNKLKRIAEVLEVPFEDVLISPERIQARLATASLIQEAVANALRERDLRLEAKPLATTDSAPTIADVKTVFRKVQAARQFGKPKHTHKKERR